MTGKFGWEGFAFGFGPRAWGFRGRRSGGRRQWFGAGDMKYVILKLLRDKPRHGYEVMKELVERTVGGSMAEVNRSLGQLVKAVYRTGWKTETEAARKNIAAILAKAKAEIEALATSPESRS